MKFKPIYMLLWCSCFKTYFCQKRNNACPTLEDYANIDYNENCWYNPDIFATPEDLARNHGFQYQNHSVVTEDGYYLTVFRVQDRFTAEKKQPILLHHGLFTTGASFMATGNMSLAFYLAQNGYDVWMSNHRGTIYSNGHTYLNMSEPEYWRFSFHEIGLYDLPATLEYITGTTGGFTKTIYIGHSQGTTEGFIYSSLKQEHSMNHLKGFIALSPAVYFKYVYEDFRLFLPTLDRIGQEALSNNITVLIPRPAALSKLVHSFCRANIQTCVSIYHLIAGTDEDLSAEYALVGLSYVLTRTSLKCLAHFIQLNLSGKFRPYDYGRAENLRRYNSFEPPEYPLEDINIPVHLFYGLNDNLVSHQNMALIFDRLKVTGKSMNVIPETPSVKYNHVNFIASKNIEKYFYQSLMRMLKKLNS